MANIAVLTSGGVDSAVALKILKDQGHNVTAHYIKIWLEDEFSSLGNCPWQDDLDMVRKVADSVGCEVKVTSLQQEYWDRVVSNMLRDVKLGMTPNPDALCNRDVKFGAFMDAISGQCDLIASGHYADKHMGYLRMNPDPVKDQTLFLSRLRQEQLDRIVFPIGQLHKHQVRDLAVKMGLPNSARADSQGICFLGKISYNQFIQQNLGTLVGNVVNCDTGEVIGTHQGYWFHTIGQRKGLNLPGGPWFIQRKDCIGNTIFVKRGHPEPILHFRITDLVEYTDPEDELFVRIRHGGKLIRVVNRCEHDDVADITIVEGDPGIAPGQTVAFYGMHKGAMICTGSGIVSP